MHNKRSIGKLRTATRIKPNRQTSLANLHRTTMTEFAQEFRETGADQIECNMAGWFNVDASGKYITVS